MRGRQEKRNKIQEAKGKKGESIRACGAMGIERREGPGCRGVGVSGCWEREGGEGSGSRGHICVYVSVDSNFGSLYQAKQFASYVARRHFDSIDTSTQSK
jgi:hypothetical protein